MRLYEVTDGPSCHRYGPYNGSLKLRISWLVDIVFSCLMKSLDLRILIALGFT